MSGDRGECYQEERQCLNRSQGGPGAMLVKEKGGRRKNGRKAGVASLDEKIGGDLQGGTTFQTKKKGQEDGGQADSVGKKLKAQGRKDVGTCVGKEGGGASKSGCQENIKGGEWRSGT
jgi:hypothetical protein